MAWVQEPEVQLAQRLASNEKPVRTKAIKKLRKYIHVRSQKAADGFTADELLKLWKGLFYCLWMQDKPLLQEQLSSQISSLIHSFHHVDGQLLYLQTFLQTFKREWTGIDRLRMDKFFQLVRFMFRQTFQMLKKTDWDSSVVSRFLELLTAQLLHSSSEAPCGLQFHVVDLYMEELAAVAADELTADQNLVFIEPFCKTAARTKDQALFAAIRSSFFNTIIEQAPFAIEDLMKELKAAADLDLDSDSDSDSDSGQASEEEPGQADKREQKRGGATKKPQLNGSKSKEDEGDEDELLEESDSAGDEDVGPVLQFDYGALAAKLFQLASRSNTPSRNRRQLYGVVKVLRNLNEGIFPRYELPQEVSTDEDDDMFCSRKRMKKRRRMNEEGEEPPATKKSKKKKEGSSTSSQQNEPKKEKSADSASQKKRKRKRRKKKKSTEEGGCPHSQPENAAVKTTEEEPSERFRGDESSELQERTNVPSEKKKKLEEVQLGAGGHGPAAHSPAKKKKKIKRRAAQNGDVPSANEETAVTHAPTPAKKKKIQEETPQVEEEDGISTVTAEKKQQKKKKKKLPAAKIKADSEDEATASPEDQTRGSTSEKKKKKKKKTIPVVFEFEADELQNFSNGDATEATAPVGGDSPCLSAKKSQKKKKKTQSDFVAFQTNAAVPTPLFCRAKGGASRKPQTPKSESKKVTFGLTNNKTAEFRVSDRSLLVSPEGSSRVPFDPQQKPKFGVLKSPATPLAATVGIRKRVGTPKRAAKPRPTAADFF